MEGSHYLQVALPAETTAFNFYYTTRSANGSAAPAKIIIEGSLDGVSFNKISTLTDGLPTGGKETYNSEDYGRESRLRLFVSLFRKMRQEVISSYGVNLE